MNHSFDTKSKDVMEGRMTIMATSSAFWRPGTNDGVREGNFTNRLLANLFLSSFSGLLYGAMLTARNPDYSRDMRGNLIEMVPTSALMSRLLFPPVIFSAVAATYTIMESNSESMRQKADPWNAAVGGGFAGLLIGLLTKRMDRVIPSALGCSAVMATIDGFGLSMKFVEEGITKGEERKPPSVFNPRKHQESVELVALKEKYPKFKDL